MECGVVDQVSLGGVFDYYVNTAGLMRTGSGSVWVTQAGFTGMKA